MARVTPGFLTRVLSGTASQQTSTSVRPTHARKVLESRTEATRDGVAEKSMGSVPSAEHAASTSEDGATPNQNVALLPSIRRADAAIGQPKPCNLYVGLFVLGPNTRPLRDLLIELTPELDKLSGDLVHLAVLGNPRHSGDRFRRRLRQALPDVEAEWDQLVDRHGGDTFTIATAEQRLEEILGISSDQWPCLLLQRCEPRGDLVTVPLHTEDWEDVAARHRLLECLRHRFDERVLRDLVEQHSTRPHEALTNLWTAPIDPRPHLVITFPKKHVPSSNPVRFDDLDLQLGGQLYGTLRLLATQHEADPDKPTDLNGLDATTRKATRTRLSELRRNSSLPRPLTTFLSTLGVSLLHPSEPRFNPELKVRVVFPP